MKKYSSILFAACAFVAAEARAQLNYGEALQKAIYFYEEQQAGPKASWNRVPWRGSSTINDGLTASLNTPAVSVDLRGGFNDAGDHVKFGFAMASAMTVLAWGVIENNDAYVQTGQRTHVLNTLRWAADYLIRAHDQPNRFWAQVGEGGGGHDHGFWGPAEVVELATHTGAAPRRAFAINDSTCRGSDMAGEAAAAMAAISIVFQTDDPPFAATLRTHAAQLYSMAWGNGTAATRGVYSACIPASPFYTSFSGYNDELVWSAIWLYRATGDNFYRDRAIADYANLSTEQGGAIKSFRWTLAWDDKSFACYVLLAMLTGQAQYRTDAERWLDWWLPNGNGGPHVNYTPGGLAFLDSFGPNRYAANTAFVALVYSDYLRANFPANNRANLYYDFAVSQVEYLLGDNPRDLSYMIGFSGLGSSWPQNPHHRTAHGSWSNSLTEPAQTRHVLYGGLVGGPNSDDSFPDDRNQFQKTEVALDFNAAFAGAIARLWRDFGGAPLNTSQFPPAEPAQTEFVVGAARNAFSTNFVEIKAVIQNMSTSPAQGRSDLSFRYFVNLSEVFSQGLNASNVTITTAFSQATSISPLQVWGNPADRIYYVQVSFSGQTIFPGGQDQFRREAQFRLALPTGATWDNNNDPSWDASYLTATGNLGVQAPKIPVYGGTVRLSGIEPAPACGGSTGVNCVPVANNLSVTTPFQTAANVTLGGSDQDGTITSFAIVNQPSSGTLSGTGANRVYTPNTGFFGPDLFRYTVTDNGGAVSAAATVNLTVQPGLSPAVNITAPADNTQIAVGAQFSVVYTVSNAAGVRVAINGTQVASGTGSGTIVLTAPSAAGAFTVTLTAVDGAGNPLGASDSVPLVATQSTPSALSCSFGVGSNWDAGFVGTITVANPGTNTVNGWQVVFSLASGSSIVNLWGGTHSGTNPFTVVPPSGWNGTIPANGSVQFGFQANKGTPSASPPSVTITTCR